MLETGYKISDLNIIPVSDANGTYKNKISLDETYMLGYANTVYGIKYNRNNYRIPLSAIRNDIKGYIGIESLVAPWSEQMKLWHGIWNDAASKNRSYVYEWTDEDATHPHYMPEKFSDLENSYYIIRNAPFPYETEDCNNRGERGEIVPELNSEGENIITTNKKLEAADPHSNSNKLVLKSYVDERLAAKRLIDVTTDFWVRDYDCTYVIRATELQKAAADLGEDEKLVIKIHYPSSFEERIKHNNLEFKLLVEGIETAEGSGVYVPAVSNLVAWQLLDSNSNDLTICWLNKTDKDEIIIPNIHEERLYDNARYISFTFKTVTDTIQNFDKIELLDGKEEKTGEYTKAVYSVYASCENMLYRNRAVTTVNGNIVEHLHFTSIDNSVIVNNKFESGNLTLDLSVNRDVPEYDIISPDDSVIINKIEKENKDVLFELSIIKPRESEFLSSDTVKVIERHTDKAKYYSFEIKQPQILPLDAGIIAETDGVNWVVGNNLILRGDSNVNIEEIDTDTEKGWFISVDIPEVEEPQEILPTQLIELPSVVNFVDAKYKVYKVNAVPTFTCDTSGLIDDETVSTKIYLNTSNNTQDIAVINETLEWVMTKNNTSPLFKPGRLYCISLTALPDFINNAGYKVLARVDWFQNL